MTCPNAISEWSFAEMLQLQILKINLFPQNKSIGSTTGCLIRRLTGKIQNIIWIDVVGEFGIQVSKLFEQFRHVSNGTSIYACTSTNIFEYNCLSCIVIQQNASM